MSDFVFRTGKHTGKTLEWVEQNDSSWLTWVKANRPEMLKVIAVKPSGRKNESELPDHPITAMKPNMNFDNEKIEKNDN